MDDTKSGWTAAFHGAPPSVPSQVEDAASDTHALSVLIADYNAAECETVADVLLMSIGGGANIYSATSLGDSFNMLRKHSEISLFVLNPGLPDVMSNLSFRLIRRVSPQVRLVLFAGNFDRIGILQALEAGVHGIIPKTYDLSQTSAAFKHILNDQIYVPTEVAWLSSQCLASDNCHRGKQGIELTPRQREIVDLIKSGKSRREIATKLSLSENTVKAHANTAYRVLGIRARSALTNS